MNKQIKLYSINLGMAKTEQEKELYRLKYINERSLYRIKDKISNRIKKELSVDEWTKECSDMFKERLRNNIAYKVIEESNKKIVELIHEQILKNNDIRCIDSKYFKQDDIIALFSNDSTRIMNLEDNDSPILDFITIEVGNTDSLIMEDVIKKGLYIIERVKTGVDENDVDKIEIKKNKYRFFTAGAGQTRQKKFMMIKEEVWNKYEKTLMCGLSIEDINKMGGINVNKFNAYFSLNNSASDIVENFDIDRCIVVDDFTEEIEDVVDYIGRNDKVEDGKIEYIDKNGKSHIRKKYKVGWDIKRQKMIVPIDFMDGAGICLPKVFKKNTQIRLPWFKGLLCPIDYVNFVNKFGYKTKIIDLYGKQYDIIEDDIQVIFTKSQFKMWKFYKDVIDENTGEVIKTGWEVYKECFKKYNRTLNKCMEDEDKLKDMRINYQMLQTLTAMSDEQIDILTKETKELINDLHVSKEKQLEFLGATLENKNRNYMQEILRLYPEMLTSKYIKKQLSETITSYKKKIKSGKIKLNSKRVFIVPDLIHFISVLFGDGELYGLNEDEVYFSVYNDSDELALLRSPHLSREWYICKNASYKEYDCDNKDLLKKYFKTNGVYVSSKSLSSLVLMNDWDGDETLIIKKNEQQKWLIDLAKYMMKDLVPIYYEMGGGEATEINYKNIFNNLTFVYNKSNIGKVSNTLTNIWSRKNPDEKMDEIKKLCAYNNWIIDSAKKLELPKLPKEIRQLMNNKTYPYFFQFAKGKNKNECRQLGLGVLDRICKSIDNIENTDFIYDKSFGKFNVKNLLSDKRIKEYNKEIIDFYNKIELDTRNKIKSYVLKNGKEGKLDFNEMFYREAREKVLEFSKSIGVSYEKCVDNIIIYTFNKDELKMSFLFNVFGAVIINNINRNIKLSIDDKKVGICRVCGKRYKKKTVNSNQKYCDKCSKEINKNNAIKRYYNK